MTDNKSSTKYFVTTAIDYINGKPHIGHSYEKVAADVLARFHRAKIGVENVRFLTGTDEHGAKIEDYAKDSGLEIQEFADKTSAGFKLAWDNLNISYDRFIRTTDADHIKVVEEILTKIKENGFLYEADYEGLYCVGHEAFLTEKDLVDSKKHEKKVKKVKTKIKENKKEGKKILKKLKSNLFKEEFDENNIKKIVKKLQKITALHFGFINELEKLEE